MADDSDDDLLADLLSIADDNPAPTPVINEPPKPRVLKDHNFLEDTSGNLEDEAPIFKTSEVEKEPVSLLNDHANSSDDEDQKYFEKSSYTDYGRDIKHLLKTKESENENRLFSFNNENSFNSPSGKVNTTPKSNSFKTKVNSPSTPIQKSDKHSLQVSLKSNNPVKGDVYTDPIFGLRINKPLVSSQELVQKMEGRKAVKISNIKFHLSNEANLNEDWVVAGVIISKGSTLTSQKGNQYCIFKLSDLTGDMKAITVFLFKGAHKNFWKLSVGTIFGILNPSVMDSRDDKDLATLSVDNPQKIMVLGTSRDLGTCKSKKKNGEPCTVPVNLSNCEYCVYHVKQEYGKYANRSEFGASSVKSAFGHKTDPFKKVGVMQQRHPDANPFIAIPGKRNEAQYKKDRERLALLRGDKKPESSTIQSRSPTVVGKKQTMSVELSTQQVKRDAERLNKLREFNANKKPVSPPPKEEKRLDIKLNLPPPKLGAGMKNGIIDFSQPISRNQVHRAKLSAIELAKKMGGFQKTNPNKIRSSKKDLSEKGVKRRREEEEGEIIAKEAEKKQKVMKNRFQEMLEKSSAHSDLIEKRESEETNDYFKKLEVKERMEEKMLTTFKLDCKAVRCAVCKYVAFSSSDLCKKLQHPIKVIDAVKRFFKCSDCGNRTITLERIPTETCKKCASSKWVKTAMMDEKRTQITGSKLCIRGGEEKFIGSLATDASLNLCVPDPD